VLDVTDRGAVAAMLDRVGPVDVLVNSAGMARHGPALETEEADYDAVMEVNVKAAFVLAQEVARRMEAGPGSIIQISSQMGHVGGHRPGGLLRHEARGRGDDQGDGDRMGRAGIRVNTICPTFILTPLTEGTFADPEKRAWIEGKIKLGRVGEVEDIMGAVVFLASDASSLVTGTALAWSMAGGRILRNLSRFGLWIGRKR
jgi:NAD(P)-dependent dehydrogenase (short-subunit alcohol dehydrogenase family)